MKLHKLALLPLAACAVFGTVAQADTGDITFKGRVVSTGCTPNIDGQGASGEVKLPSVFASQFANQGDTTGEKPFTIKLTGCTANSKVKAYFHQAAANSAGRLTKNRGAGEGWTYELLPATGSDPLKAGTSLTGFAADGNDVGVTVDATGAGNLTYRVRYYNETGTLTSGDMEADATYVLYLD